MVGLEAVSRGATSARLIEKDPRQVADIQKYAGEFGVADKVQVLKSDAYRWAERWIPAGTEPVNLFLSPPFPDLSEKAEEFLNLVRLLLEKAPDESVLTIQAEDGFPLDKLPDPAAWDVRSYGRNMLLIYVVSRGSAAAPPAWGKPARIAAITDSSIAVCGSQAACNTSPHHLHLLLIPLFEGPGSVYLSAFGLRGGLVVRRPTSRTRKARAMKSPLWLRQLSDSLTGRQARPARRPRNRLSIESLEAREVPAGFSFPDFSPALGLEFLGAATINSNDHLRLSSAAVGGSGSAWYTAEKQFVGLSFETTFQFQLTEGTDPPRWI